MGGKIPIRSPPWSVEDKAPFLLLINMSFACFIGTPICSSMSCTVAPGFIGKLSAVSGVNFLSVAKSLICTVGFIVPAFTVSWPIVPVLRQNDIHRHKNPRIHKTWFCKGEVYPRPKGCGYSLPPKSGIKPDTTWVDVLKEQAQLTLRINGFYVPNNTKSSGYRRS